MRDSSTDIIIIGAGITGLATAFHLKKASKKVLLLDKSARAGGVIQTDEQKGFVYERGPNTGILGNEAVVRLFDHLSDKCKLEVANSNMKKRFILKDAKWEELPSGLGKAIGTPLFTMGDKFRILGEPFRKKGTNPDETLSELVVRRLGKSFLDYAIDPFILGVYAGDPAYLVPKYALPKLYNLEQQYGSFIRGTLKKKKEPKTELEKRATREVFSFQGGLSELVQALCSFIGSDNMMFGVCNVKINPLGDGFLVEYQKAGNTCQIHAKQVVSTIGAYNLPAILPFIEQVEMTAINNLKYTKVIEIALGFEHWTGFSLDGFGGLIPFKENRDLLGIMFMSSLMQARAPEDGALFSLFMGGVRREELIDMIDQQVVATVKREMKELMGMKDFKPDLFEIIRHDKAIPQYGKESKERFEAIERVEQKYKGLFIAGNLRDGIGMADRIQQAEKVAEQLLAL